MKALIVIDIDENHLLKETNELYERLNGYKCKLKPMPKIKNDDMEEQGYHIAMFNYGWNACLEEITDD